LHQQTVHPNNSKPGAGTMKDEDDHFHMKLERIFMKIATAFKVHFDELQERHIQLREGLNACSFTGVDLENMLSVELEKYEPWRFALMDKLGQITADFNREEKKNHIQYIRQTTYHQIVQEAPFYWRIINKPNGYAGDAFMMDFIYQNRFEGKTPFGKLLHKNALASMACQAVRNRKVFLKEQILKAGCGKVLSLAAGSAQEIREILNGPAGEKFFFHALDHDMDALVSFQDLAKKERFDYFLANAFQITSQKYNLAKPRLMMSQYCSPRRDFRGWRRLIVPMKYHLDSLKIEDYDLIYSAGLYDYIKTFLVNPNRGTIALTRNLFVDLLKPGGTLIIGNFSQHNPRDVRFAMEYIYDWNLIYRNKDDVFEFARDVPKQQIQDMVLLEEPLRINYFLKIIKK
jgi:extracellular factor (EF) 3-hydroxypalmitic acid methyl ester biosynthesis protein